MAQWISLPFSHEMYHAIQQGQKVCTTRSEKKGEIGDLFVVSGRAYRIVDIQEQTLNDVARLLYRQEGFKDSGDFIRFWKLLHPGKPYLPGRTQYVHWFARIEDPIIEIPEANA